MSSLVLIVLGIIILISGLYVMLRSLLLCDVIDNIKVQLMNLGGVLLVGAGLGCLASGFICMFI